MVSPAFRFVLAAALLAAPAALPAQRMSDSYEFLKAVREADGNKVTQILDKPGSRIINTRDDSGDAALHIVTKRGDVTYLRFLIARGANINIQDGRGNTPLMLAVSASCFDCVDVLTQQKANVNLANASGETPLIRAVQLRNLEMARRLLDAGGNPDQRDVVAGLSARDYATRDTRSPALTKLLADAPKAGSSRRVAGPGL
ncbi:ankyrin repeat domain-containing protein [Sphingomonas cannabina]|uniref:ankyrin repeat domain-containing protein n=1 Tax=Sphingomonas cannabina TaxID=2899123 RepID=UPI001F261540|nr:ankyrin repeat domain-containing protein [Sphingomonas cannabina]UIJ45709.1 ankyrin repeat domain-containing protein [Sphingomonas cannabina]